MVSWQELDAGVMIGVASREEDRFLHTNRMSYFDNAHGVRVRKDFPPVYDCP
jgi:hypothetical protein